MARGPPEATRPWSTCATWPPVRAHALRDSQSTQNRPLYIALHRLSDRRSTPHPTAHIASASRTGTGVVADGSPPVSELRVIMSSGRAFKRNDLLRLLAQQVRPGRTHGRCARINIISTEVGARSPLRP